VEANENNQQDAGGDHRLGLDHCQHLKWLNLSTSTVGSAQISDLDSGSAQS
jgi:hypothetical protein